MPRRHELTTEQKWMPVDYMLDHILYKERSGTAILTDFELYIQYNYSKDAVMGRKEG